MKTLFTELKTALLLTLVLAFLLCGAYPLAVWAAGQALFADKANGSLITDSTGTVRGSALIGQSFASEKYFQSRPSAAGAGYDASSSSGTNLGPTSQKLNDSIKSAVAAYRASNGLKESDRVPADAVTSSGSGLDPHISIANAEIQARRVARVRQIPVEQVLSLVASHIDARDWGVLGEPGVNVLTLNLALDQPALAR